MLDSLPDPLISDSPVSLVNHTSAPTGDIGRTTPTELEAAGDVSASVTNTPSAALAHATFLLPEDNSAIANGPAENSTGLAVVAGVPAVKNRPMVKASLLGKHCHETSGGPSVLIYLRDGRYLARGFWQRQRFGETLPAGTAAAEARLAEMITELRNGTYLRPSEARRQPLKHGPVTRLSLRQLVDRFLAEKRRLRGKNTAADYQARLAAVLEFAQAPKNLRRWPYVQDVDRSFGVELRAFLFSRSVGMTAVYTHSRPGTVRRQLEAALANRPAVVEARAWVQCRQGTIWARMALPLCRNECRNGELQ